MTELPELSLLRRFLHALVSALRCHRSVRVLNRRICKACRQRWPCQAVRATRDITRLLDERLGA